VQVPKQTLPHAPQLKTFVLVSTQKPLHTLWVIEHEHTPRVHTAPVAQGMSHPPQWSVSMAVLTQAPSQSVVSATHALVQTPSEHTSSSAHGLSHIPQ